MCEQFHTLPLAGGILDQDSLFMYVLQETLVWKEQRKELDQQKAKSQNAGKR